MLIKKMEKFLNCNVEQNSPKYFKKKRLEDYYRSVFHEILKFLALQKNPEDIRNNLIKKR